MKELSPVKATWMYEGAGARAGVRRGSEMRGILMGWLTHPGAVQLVGVGVGMRGGGYWGS